MVEEEEPEEAEGTLHCLEVLVGFVWCSGLLGCEKRGKGFTSCAFLLTSSVYMFRRKRRMKRVKDLSANASDSPSSC